VAIVERFSRRQFLTTAGGIAFATAALPTGLRRVLADGSSPAAGWRAAGGVLSQIEHVVVLMQENRSFDHYFGTMPGVRGFADPSATTRVFRQPDPDHPDGYLLPFHADTHRSSSQALPSNSHAWGVQHQSWNRGRMDGFVTSHLAADGPDGRYSMAYFTEADIPFHWALANAFTVCDGYHCSMLGPTSPNRLYLMTGTVDPRGERGGPVTTNDVPPSGFRWTTYPERLTDAGVSWRVYQDADNGGLNVLEHFSRYRDAPTSSPLYQQAIRRDAAQFEHDAARDRLPTVSWIVPTSYQSEHPDHLPAAGADFIAGKVNAVASNPDVWASTVFFLVYDENDGFFDHVAPPTAPPGTADEHITVDGASQPIGLGFRVPCVVVSPWTVGGHVAHDTFDHTSVLRFLERLTGVPNPNISAWRRRTVGDFTGVLGCRPAGRSPRLPPTAAELALAEREVRTLPRPPVPLAAQSFPTQPRGLKRRPGGC
jgi:phospholipase C